MLNENEGRVVTLYVCPTCEKRVLGPSESACSHNFTRQEGESPCERQPVEYVPKQELTQAEERGRVLVEALRELVRLKDGPRDDAYRAQKVIAWQEAREALDSSTGSR